MRNLLLFLARFRVLILFIILEVVALSSAYRSHLYHHATMVNSSNRIVGKALAYRENVTGYFGLRAENAKLAAENARLRAKLRYISKYPPIDSMLADTSDKYKYSYITAKVVNNSINRFDNYITLDKGKKQGVRSSMGVIDSRGVVGVVTDVSDDFALVMSAVNINSFISVRHKKSGAFGTLTWYGKNPFRLDVIDMSKSAAVQPGDTILTSGYSTFFPPDHPVGIVKSVNSRSGSGFLDIRIKPTNDFNKLSYVYVVLLEKRPEIDTLESKATTTTAPVR